MGFNPPVPQNDSDWEIRVAVLLSLLLQVLLIFVGPMRKRSSHPVPRFAVWSCYLLADWVADLALGLLLNNMGNIGGNGGGAGSSSISHASGLKRGAGGGVGNSGGSPIIFAFWTPFLLLHLGGPDTITAYSLEDNELWLRHLIGLLFELFSASVIFFCSLKGNPMIPATVLIFLVGIIKYGERTYSLYSGSVDGFRESILGDPDPGPNYAKLMTEFDAKEKAGLVVEIVIADGEAKKAQEEMEKDETIRLVETSHKSLEARAHDFFLIFRRLFVNLILSYKERKISQAYFVKRKDITARKAFEVIEVELNFIYDMVYTKAPVAHSKAGCPLRFVCSGCIVSALVIFFFLDKGRNGISQKDAGITYALLLGGLALDAAALTMFLCSNRMLVWLEGTPWLAWLAQVVRFLLAWLAQVVRFLLRWRQRRWSERTSQMNLISYCLDKPDRKDDEGGGHCRRCSNCCFANPPVISYCLDKPDRKDDEGGGHSRRCSNCCFANPPGISYCLYKPDRKDDEGGGHCRRCSNCCFANPRVIRALAKVAGMLRLREIFDDFFFIRRERLSCGEGQEEHLLLEFMFDGLQKAAEKLEGKDYKEIKTVCDCRGEGVLMGRKNDIMEKLRQSTPDAHEVAEENFSILLDSVNKRESDGVLVSSLKREFDESLLLWHIATDLCLLREEKTAEQKDTQNMRSVGKTLSEYMLYLLIKQPEMLSAAAGIGLLRYRDTCAEARRFFQSAAVWNPDHTDARRMLLKVNTTKKPAMVKGDRSKSVLFDAVILAKVLRKLDDTLMWDVVAGVWREMLTYAAGKCRGSTHVRQLSRGGELITLVWFLMAHMGIGDMYQIQEGDAKAKLLVHDQ